MASTRAHDNPILGGGQEMGESVLPTRSDVSRYYTWLWDLEKGANNNQNPSFKVVSKKVVDKVKLVWKKASIPTISDKAMTDLLKKELDVLQNLNKSYKRDKDKASFKNKLSSFSTRAQELFDVAACKCNDFELCRCEYSKKVPLIERDFLTDQRSTRKMQIGHVDLKVTSSLKKKLDRKNKHEEFLCKKRCEEQNIFYNTS